MMQREVTVVELIPKVFETYVERGYSCDNATKIKKVYEKLSQYCTECGELNYSEQLMERFLNDIYGVGIKSSELCGAAKRAINMLRDYWVFEDVLPKTKRERVFSPQFAETSEMYLDILRQRHLSIASIIRHQLSLIRFTDYLHSQNLRSPGEITIEHINGFLKSAICNYSNKVIYFESSIMRKYLRLIWECGKHPFDLSDKVPYTPNRLVDNRIPSAYTKDEIERMLATVDRDSPVGKRDYVILLLATRLGLRASDVRNLTFTNINWDSNTISIVQVKTKAPLTLPLIPEVGWALIDYIQNGRPVTDTPEILVKMHPPHTPLAGFNSIVLKHLRRAKIPLAAHKQRGMHSLRHSLATRLLEEETPLHIIQEVLGHLDCESTADYLSIDIPHLKLCALEVPK
jgi:site-specific recombinase XerD